MEHKLINIAEVKFASDGADTKIFSGYGAVFGNVDSYGDVIEPGAFAKSLKSDNMPLMFLNHDPYSLPIGKWLSMEEDGFGLKVTGEFLDTTTGTDAYIASKAGAITGLSIGYIPQEVKLGRPGTSEPMRLIKSVELIEVSVVTIPANDKARILDVKSLEEADEFERDLLRRGFSLQEAQTFLKNHSLQVEYKYQQAVTLSAAKELLSTIKEHNV